MNREIGRGRGAGAGQGFKYQRRVEALEAGAADILGDIDAAKSERSGIAQGGDRKNPVAVPLGGMRREFAGGELARRFLKGGLLGAQCEIHGGHFNAPPQVSQGARKGRNQLSSEGGGLALHPAAMPRNARTGRWRE